MSVSSKSKEKFFLQIRSGATMLKWEKVSGVRLKETDHEATRTAHVPQHVGADLEHLLHPFFAFPVRAGGKVTHHSDCSMSNSVQSGICNTRVQE